jgi:hypothetical protein
MWPQKNSWGNSDRDVGSARHAEPERGFRPALVGENRDSARRLIGWLDITPSKFYDWRERYGKVNERKC